MSEALELKLERISADNYDFVSTDGYVVGEAEKKYLDGDYEWSWRLSDALVEELLKVKVNGIKYTGLEYSLKGCRETLTAVIEAYDLLNKYLRGIA